MADSLQINAVQTRAVYASAKRDPPKEVVEAKKSLEKSQKLEKKQKISDQDADDRIKVMVIKVSFELDKKTGDVVATVFDSKTGEVIRQIPPEEMRKLAQMMQEYKGRILSRLL